MIRRMLIKYYTEKMARSWSESDEDNNRQSCVWYCRHPVKRASKLTCVTCYMVIFLEVIQLCSREGHTVTIYCNLLQHVIKSLIDTIIHTVFLGSV